MKDFGTVNGSIQQAQPLIVVKDTVYVHTNIQKLETDDNGNHNNDIYSYHEIQYTKDEYIELLANRNQQLESIVEEHDAAIAQIYGGA